MIGTNSMQINTATMMKIVDHYFKTVLFKECNIKVIDVAASVQNGPFVVKFETEEKADGKST